MSAVKFRSFGDNQIQFQKKIVSPGLKKLSWKKGGLAVGEATLHCEKARK